MFAFNPLTDEQIYEVQNRGLLADGIYPFIVKSAEYEISQSGNKMLKVRVGVMGQNNDERVITDYLVATEAMIFKIKHFCESLGLEDKYNLGTFSAGDCLGRSGHAKIGVQKGSEKKDGSGFFNDKNCVKDYVKLEAVKVAKVEEAPFNDDIKF